MLERDACSFISLIGGGVGFHGATERAWYVTTAGHRGSRFNVNPENLNSKHELAALLARTQKELLY